MRKFEVDDLFRMEHLGRFYGGPFSFSPDGRSLAYVLQRPKETAALHKYPRLVGNDRADVWLVEPMGGPPGTLRKGSPMLLGTGRPPGRRTGSGWRCSRRGEAKRTSGSGNGLQGDSGG